MSAASDKSTPLFTVARGTLGEVFKTKNKVLTFDFVCDIITELS